MKHKTQTKRLLSLMLALCMVISMFSGLTLMASAADGTFELVTKDTPLKAGDQIIIGEPTYNAAMAPLNGKIYASQAGRIADGKISDVTGLEVVTLEASAEAGKFALKVSSGKYIASTSAKTMTEVADKTANGASWTITIDADSRATITPGAAGNILYNKGSPRFTTYTSQPSASMLLPCIYKMASGDDNGKKAINTSVTGKHAELTDISVPAKAAKDEVVTVTSTGKKIESAYVLGETTATEIPSEITEDGLKCTFTMPNEDVSLEVKLEDYYDVVLGEVTGGTEADVVVNPAVAPAGEMVTVSASASKIIESVTCNPEREVVEVDGAYCFEMPAGEVLVSVALADKPTTTYTKVTKPADGDVVAIVLDQNAAANDQAITTTASGNKLAPATVTRENENTVKSAENIAFTVSVDENGYYSFVADGKYLTTGATGNSLTLADAASDYSLWTLEAAGENGWFIKSVNAAYNGNGQYLEFYNNFTVFGKSATANEAIYTFNFYKDYGDQPIPEKYAITTTVTGNKAELTDINVPAEATEGEDVVITGTTKKIVGVVAKKASGATVDAIKVDDHNFMFTMPGEAVSLTVELESYYDVLLSVAGGEETDVTVTPTVAPKGEVITVTASEGKTIEKVECLPTCEVLPVDNAYCFEMPGEDVVVGVTLKTAPVFKIDTDTSVQGNGVVVSDPTSAPEGAEVKLDAMADDGYELTEWGYRYLGTEDMVEVPLSTDNLSVTFTMPAADVEVYATFAEKVVTYYDVLLYGYNYELNLDGVEEGTTLEGLLPDAAEMSNGLPTGYTFVGWTEANADNEDGSCPELYVATTPVTTDLILNAVYAKDDETGGSGDYVKVTENPDPNDPNGWSGEYLIVYEGNGTDARVLDGALNADGLSALDNAVGASIVNGDTISANSCGDYAVTIEKVTGGYSILTKSNVYIGHTGSKNTLNTKAEPFVNKISYDATKNCAVIAQPNTDYVLRYNAANNVKAFRFYKGSQQPIQLYKKQAGSFSYTLKPVAAVDDLVKVPVIILNYDRNVTIGLDKLVDTVAVASRGLTVTDVETDLYGSDKWAKEEPIGLTGTATSDATGIHMVDLRAETGLRIDGAYRVTFSDGTQQESLITIMSAQKVYCEDDNTNVFAFADGKKGIWQEEILAGTEKVTEQDATEEYTGLDSHYANCATYSGNAAHVVTVGKEVVKEDAAAEWPTVTFSFQGTGFELISAANAEGGLGKVEVRNSDGAVVTTYIFSSYYGGFATYNETTGQWDVAPGNATVNQAPIAAHNLDFGAYDVTVSAIYTPNFDYEKKGEYKLVIDGLRVVNPLGDEALAYEDIKFSDMLDTGLDKLNMYIDGKGDISAKDALEFGPANEIYLKPGQAIPVKFMADTPEQQIGIGARAYAGAATTLGIYAANSGALTTPLKTVDIATATEMHYYIQPTFTQNKEANWYETATIVLKNDGTAPLALSSARCPADVMCEITNESYETAAKFVKRMAQNKQNFASLTDVDANAWYFSSVKFAVESGIMAGVGDNRFAPKQELTRAMAVRVLYVLAGKPEAKANTSFTDVVANAWYADAVAWGAENGIVAGVTATKFDPNGKLTREQMVTFLYRYAGKAQVADNAVANYTDGAKVSAYAVNAMNWAIANGIVSGMGNGTLAPKATANRAQMASILAHCDELYAN